MARMSKRISNKITKTKEQQNAPKEQKKYGKDIWLILLIVINFLLLVTMWESLILAPISFATYFYSYIQYLLIYSVKIKYKTKRLVRYNLTSLFYNRINNYLL